MTFMNLPLGLLSILHAAALSMSLGSGDVLPEMKRDDATPLVAAAEPTPSPTESYKCNNECGRG